MDDKEKKPNIDSECCETLVLGTGHSLPERVVPNDEFAKTLDTSDEWIRTRTGIRERRFAAVSERTSEYGADAGRKALEAAGITPDQVGAIIVCTNTPDMRLPATANFVQGLLGADNAYCYDVGAACCGFIFAMASAHAHIHTGLARYVLVVGAEIYSSILDFTDRKTCVLFGDGAGAVVLGQGMPVNSEPFSSGVMAVSLDSNSDYTEILQCAGGGTARRENMGSAESVGISMEGKMVFKLAIHDMAKACRDVLHKTGLDMADVNWVVPHQANIRIIDGLAKNLKCPREKVIVNVDRIGNTSSASVPIALDEAVRDGRISKGDVVLLTAVGGGFSSGAILIRV